MKTKKEAIDAISDDFKSTFTILSESPLVIANMAFPNEVETIIECIRKQFPKEKWSVSPLPLKTVVPVDESIFPYDIWRFWIEEKK